MKHRLMTIVFLTMALSAGGALIEHPDDNTLWIEDGVDIVTVGERPPNLGQGIWHGGLAIAPRKEGGFSLVSETEEKFTKDVKIPYSPKYPYWVVEIDAFNRAGTKYRNFIFGWFYKLPSTWLIMTDNTQPGLFVWKAFNDEDAPKAQLVDCRTDLYGFKVDFKYVKMVKVPDNYLTIESATMTKNKELRIGDEVKFTAFLKAAAEGVSIRLYDPYYLALMKLNGMDDLPLTPEKREGAPANSVWSASIKVESLTGYTEAGLQNAKSRILIKTTVLGGKLNVPIWTPLGYGYAPKIEK